ncbi:MAG: PorT family protein [Prevotella sp.]|nr:PorT family protein [Prevotella sp.]
MKKVFLTLACAVIALSVSAQRTGSSSSSFFSTTKSDQPITFSVRAGINFANMTLEAGKVSYSPDTYTGFHAGVAVDFPLLESFYIQSGLYYTVKGAKVEDFKEELTANPSYLEIPILASYRYNFSEAAQLQVNFGPYLAYGIGGKIKYEYERTSVEEDVFGDDAAKRFDAGLQIGAGVTIAQHYYVGCGYQFGLTDIGRDGIEVKNKNFFISLGYQF